MKRKKRKVKHIDDFRRWLKSDNIIKTKKGYLSQCTQYCKTFKYWELYRYFVHEYITVQ